MMRSRHQSQLGLPPMEVRGSHTRTEDVRNQHDANRPASSVRNPDKSQGLVGIADRSAESASLFAQALKQSGIARSEVVELLGVSASLVDKWCDERADRSPSFAQMLGMPLSFHLALNKVMNRRFGFWRSIARDLFETVGQFAAAVGD